MAALVALLTLAAAPVPKSAQPQGIVVDFSPLSQVGHGWDDVGAVLRFVGEAKSGKKVNHLYTYPHTIGKEGDVRDWFIVCLGDYLSVEKFGKTSMLIKGYKDAEGNVSPLTELRVSGKFWSIDFPEKCTPTVKRADTKK